MVDLANRRQEARAAIAVYQAELAAWAAAGTTPSSSLREVLQQTKVKPAISAAHDRRANSLSARTDRDCETVPDPTTECLTEVLQQHEHVHRTACFDQAGDRWGDLADYAREEIASYEAEVAYINGSLDNLERECRFRLEFRSTIGGTLEATRSEARTDVELEISFPRGLPYAGLAGSRPLQYDTRDVGPPKKVGDPMLAKLAPVCYAASEGRGEVSFEVRNGWIMREKVPPHAPLVQLTLEVGKTRETRRLKGQRGCPRSAEEASFWTEQFVLGKQLDAPRGADPRGGVPTAGRWAVLVDGWTISPRPGVFAEKIIERSCGAGGASSLPCERTVLTLTQKPAP